MVLYPVTRKLLDKLVVLASASPRRQDILSNAGFRFEVVPSRFKEQLSKASFSTPYAYAMETAKQKALEVASRMHQKYLRAPDIVIGADTIVVLDGLILEKPVDNADAYSMLSRLNGKEHHVFTGVAIIRCSSQGGRLDMDVLEFYEETRVQFSQLSEELLWEYIHSGEPMDKAGGYGIQALGSMLVEAVHGDFFNVVGFPLNRFCKKLSELYCAPHPKDLQWLKHDSTPATDTSDNLSDVEGGGSSQGGAQRGHNCLQAQGRKDMKDADGKPTEESVSSTVVLEPIDGYKVSKADLYILSRLLHEWPEDKAHQLLSRISSSCKPGGGLMVVEMVLDGPKQEALSVLLMSLTMNVLCQSRERSLSEHRSLLRTHGLTVVGAARTEMFCHAIPAIKA